MVPEIRSTTNRIFSHFVPFIALLYGVNNPENQKFWKNIIVKNKGGGGGLWHFDSTTNKWRIKSDYVGYKNKLKCGKILDN